MAPAPENGTDGDAFSVCRQCQHIRSLFRNCPDRTCFHQPAFRSRGGPAGFPGGDGSFFRSQNQKSIPWGDAGIGVNTRRKDRVLPWPIISMQCDSLMTEEACQTLALRMPQPLPESFAGRRICSWNSTASVLLLPCPPQQQIRQTPGLTVRQGASGCAHSRGSTAREVPSRNGCSSAGSRKSLPFHAWGRLPEDREDVQNLPTGPVFHDKCCH